MDCPKCGRPLQGGRCPKCERTLTRPLQTKGTRPFAGLFGKPQVFDYAGEGLSCFEQGDFNEAKPLLEKALAQDPNNPKIQLALGRVLALLGEYPQAVQHLVQLSSPQAFYYLGDLYQRIGRPGDAETCFKKAIAAHHLDATIALGDLYWKGNRIAEALKAYEGAIAIDPSSGMARLGLARVLMVQGNHQRALTQVHYAAAAGIPEGLLLSGDIRLAMGDPHSAIQDYTRAIEHLSSDAMLAEKLGRAHLALGETRKGIRWLRRAIALEPGLEECTLVVARMLEGDRPAIAGAYYQRLVETPYQEIALEALARLDSPG